MSSITNIPIEIKNAIFNKIRSVTDEFDNEEKRDTLFQEDYGLIDDEGDKDLFQKILDFANTQDIRSIANKNLNFCYPSSFLIQGNIVSARMSIQGAGGDLVDIFDDFTLYASRILIGKRNLESNFNSLWKQFESDFLSDKVEMVFYTQLASLYYHAGGIIENMIPKSGISIRYLHLDSNDDKALYYNLKKGLESSFRPVAPEEFSKTIPIIAEYKISVRKTDKLEVQFKNAADIFEKIAFVIRIVCGGAVHYDFVKPIFLGNLTSKGNLVQGYQSNHLFSQKTNSTTIENGPYETWITRLWSGIESRDMFEWQFVNQKIRDSYNRIPLNDPFYSYDDNYQLSKQLERIVDLIQALENIIGDYGFHNVEYLAKLIAPTDQQHQQEIMSIIHPLYKLRDKYLHGKSYGSESVSSIFTSNYQGKIELLDQKAHSLEYFIRKVLTFSIMNSDLKDKIMAYHQALGRKMYSQPRRNHSTTNQPSFPTLKSIYY